MQHVPENPMFVGQQLTDQTIAQLLAQNPNPQTMEILLRQIQSSH
jgi:hypothetical protein